VFVVPVDRQVGEVTLDYLSGLQILTGRGVVVLMDVHYHIRSCENWLPFAARTRADL
jgi:hypothetical protein